MRLLLASVLALSGVGWAGPPDLADRVSPVETVDIVHTWPHDPGAFTQGLVFHRGELLESTGQYGASTLRRVELRTGRVLQQVDLDRQYFAEGITVHRGRLYQLTWREHRCFVHDPVSLARQGALAYDGEAWGLTDDGDRLILSDGTGTLRFLYPASLAVQRTVTVLDGRRPVGGLNELEYVNGEIYANVLGERRLARIDPRDGAVLGWIDLTEVVAAVDAPDEDAVLNGIAYDAAGDRLFVTGKRWPSLFEVRVAGG